MARALRPGRIHRECDLKLFPYTPMPCFSHTWARILKEKQLSPWEWSAGKPQESRGNPHGRAPPHHLQKFLPDGLGPGCGTISSQGGAPACFHSEAWAPACLTQAPALLLDLSPPESLEFIFYFTVEGEANPLQESCLNKWYLISYGAG